METAKNIQSTNCLLIVVDALAEYGETVFHSPTALSAIKAKVKKEYNLCPKPDDVYYGEGATFQAVCDRLEEYLHLSYLRPGKLKVFYHAPVSDFFLTYNADAAYLNFYDCCIKMSKWNAILEAFPAAFEVSFEKIDLPKAIEKKKLAKGEQALIGLNQTANYALLKQTA